MAENFGGTHATHTMEHKGPKVEMDFFDALPAEIRHALWYTVESVSCSSTVESWTRAKLQRWTPGDLANLITSAYGPQGSHARRNTLATYGALHPQA